MDEIWHRGVNKYLHKKGLPPKDIFGYIIAKLWDTVPLDATVKMWAAHFKMGEESLEDGDRCGQQQLRKTLLMCT